MHPGEWVKAKRKTAGLGMRQFAVLIGELPSNWCNTENARRELPQSEDKLRAIAQVLGFRENGEDWDTLFGFVTRPVRLPTDLAQAMQIEHVPTLLRTIDERRLSGDEVQRVIKYVRKHFGKAHHHEESGR